MIPLIYIGTAHAVFMAFFFINRQPLKRSDSVVSLFMITLAMPLITAILGARAHSSGIPAHPLIMMNTWPLAYGPFLCIYARAVTGKERIPLPRLLAHFAPFIIFSAAYCIYAFLYLPAPGLINPEESVFLRIIGLTSLASLTAYSVMVFIMIRTHGRQLSDFFSSISSRVTLHWLQWITVSFVWAFAYVFLTEYGILPAPLRPIPGTMGRTGTEWIGTTFFIMAFSFFALSQPVIFAEEERGDAAPGAGKKKYERSGLKEADADQYMVMLQRYMEEGKPFLNGEITIIDISEKLNIPRHYITQILNEKMNKNFYTYINEYRVNEARRRMTDPDYRDHKVLRIAFDSGFNSKSSFNTIFKKHTGMSPSEYRAGQGQ